MHILFYFFEEADREMPL